MLQSIIAQHYLIQEKLGIGGMGTVYLGQDTRTEETVAIKQLKPDLAHDDMLERFKREGEALRDLNHPNIVKMLDAVEEDGQHYLIMEYVSGGDLSDLLKEGQLPLEKILTLSIDLADALTRTHKLNIIHRDLKPANILLAEDGTARLTDFGLAYTSAGEDELESQTIMGTVDYIAPEILEGILPDVGADIWAFGLILMESLIGYNPFSGKNISETIVAVMTASLPDLEELLPDTPVSLIDLIYRMLERDPHARIVSVRHVAAILEDILHGRNTAIAETPGFPEFESDIFALPKHNLPAQVTEFVGREAELAQLSDLLLGKGIRLVTILAPGGMGKTRLSVQLAYRVLDVFFAGVYFVELAPLTNSQQIIPSLASALNYSDQEDGTPLRDQVFDFLRDKHLLLVLDNFEHLLDATAIITEILEIAPGVQILVTSRQRTGLQGETLVHLGGMKFPDWETPADAVDYAAIQLFVNSARRALPGFELTPDNIPFITRICNRVQGMPLGIVLSASWMAILSPREVVVELAQGTELLVDESGELPERQQSIRAVMDYSWQMMNESEQQVFRQLCIFKRGFTREAAQKITGATLKILLNLTNKSLIHRDAESGRYEIHGLLRQYGQQQSGDTIEIALAHASYYTIWLDKLVKDLYPASKQNLLPRVDTEFDNIQVAWQYLIESATDRTQMDDLARLLAILAPLAPWHFAGIVTTFHSTLKKTNNPATLVYLHTILGTIDRRENRHDDALKHYQSALTLLSEAEIIQRARILRLSTVSYLVEERLAVMEMVNDVLMSHEMPENSLWWYEYIENLNDRLLTYYSLADTERMNATEADLKAVLEHATPLQRADVYKFSLTTQLRRNRYVVTDASLKVMKETLDIVAKYGTPLDLLDTYSRFGIIALLYGDLDRAESYLLRYSNLADRFGVSNVVPLSYLTVVYRMQQDGELVLKYATKCLELAQKQKNTIWYEGTAKVNQAWYYRSTGDTERAYHLAREGIEHWTANYPFQWIGLILLIDISAEKELFDRTIEYIQRLLDPLQQKLPDTIQTAFENAIIAWQDKDHIKLNEALSKAIAQSKANNLL